MPADLLRGAVGGQRVRVLYGEQGELLVRVAAEIPGLEQCCDQLFGVAQGERGVVEEFALQARPGFGVGSPVLR
jgi:hypothetical protein